MPVKCNTSRLDDNFDKQQLVGNVHHGEVELQPAGESRMPGNTLRSWSIIHPSTYSFLAFMHVHAKAFRRCDYKFKTGALRMWKLNISREENQGCLATVEKLVNVLCQCFCLRRHNKTFRRSYWKHSKGIEKTRVETDLELLHCILCLKSTWTFLDWQ